MENLKDILDQIQQHSEEENKQNVVNRAIGRGNISIGNISNKEVWIANEPYVSSYEKLHDITGVVVSTQIAQRQHTLPARYGVTIGKNTMQGRILMYNHSGEHTCVTDGRRITFSINNSATYLSTHSNITSLKVGLNNYAKKLDFSTIQEAYKQLNIKYEDFVAKQKAEEEAKKRALELKKKQEEERKLAEEEKQRKIQEAKDAEAKRIAEEEARKREEELKRIQEEERKRAEEEARLAEEERKKTEEDLDNITQQYANALSFIREQADLKNNPVIDEKQDEAKFANIYNGRTLVIDGGPGTGKTTTLIQRLKLLISEHELKDYRENHENCKLTDRDISIVSDSKRNWIFFSPTNLLRKYLDSNMQYEGLTETEIKTKVWETFLKDSLRDNYNLAGADKLPFDFEKKLMRTQDLFLDNHLQIVSDYTRYFIEHIKNKILSVEEIDIRAFEWKSLGTIIKDVCREASKIDNLSSLYILLYKLQRLNQQVMPNGLLDAKTISENYRNGMKIISTRYISQWKKDNDFYESLLDLMFEWNQQKITEDEDEEIEDDDITIFDEEVELAKQLRALLRKLALRKYKSDMKLTSKNKELMNLIGERINIDDLSELGQYAFFMQYFNPVIKNAEAYLFKNVSMLYKNYRREISKINKESWNKELLLFIVDKWKNRPLHMQEQALLFGFINNIMHTIYKYSPSNFRETKHKFAVAYKDICRPVIGIDEATDYSIIDYYAISSMRHYNISSFTLTGDIMQCLKEGGISNWKDLENQMIFPNLDIHELLVSYRQSPELLKIAEKLYKDTLQKEYPYTCYLSSSKNTPEPLWFETDDEEKKTSWIIDRILDVRESYGFVPSIAIFVRDEIEAKKLKDEIENDPLERFDDAGITCKDCSSGDALADKNTVRIFTLNSVKGLEFSVVFFHNIHIIPSTTLIDKYLYVGLSRATFYMGVTSNNISGPLENVKKLFKTNGNWKSLIRKERRGTL